MSPAKLKKRHHFVCRNKVKLATREAASDHLRTLLLRPTAQLKAHPESLEVYPCLACGGWHVGHHPRYNLPKPADVS